MTLTVNFKNDFILPLLRMVLLWMLTIQKPKQDVLEVTHACISLKSLMKDGKSQSALMLQAFKLELST